MGLTEYKSFKGTLHDQSLPTQVLLWKLEYNKRNSCWNIQKQQVTLGVETRNAR